MLPAAGEWANTDRRPSVSPIPRHELPGRIVLAVGCFTSLGCVALLLILWLGG